MDQLQDQLPRTDPINSKSNARPGMDLGWGIIVLDLKQHLEVLDKPKLITVTTSLVEKKYSFQPYLTIKIPHGFDALVSLSQGGIHLTLH